MSALSQLQASFDIPKILILGGRHFVWGSFTDQANAGLELALN
jgi:hypothetical protein